MSIGLSFPGVLEAASVGSEWAWRVIWDDLAGPIAGYARANGIRDLDDVVSEVFAQMARGIGRFEGDEPRFRSWVFTIAHGRIVDQQRRNGRRSVEQGLESFDEGDADLDPALVYELEESQRRAVDLLTGLTPEQRAVISLRILVGLSIEETAAVMGKKPNAVKQLQFRALQRLQREFLPQGVTK